MLLKCIDSWLLKTCVKIVLFGQKSSSDTFKRSRSTRLGSMHFLTSCMLYDFSRHMEIGDFDKIYFCRVPTMFWAAWKRMHGLYGLWHFSDLVFFYKFRFVLGSFIQILTAHEFSW